MLGTGDHAEVAELRARALQKMLDNDWTGADADRFHALIGETNDV